MPQPRRPDIALVVLGMALATLVAIAFVSALPISEWPAIDGKDSLANWIIAAFTVVSALISAVAVYLVRASLVQTRVAVDAAVNSNRITQQIFAAEHRPWITVGRPKIGYDEDSDTYLVDLEPRNTGKSPAIDVVLYTQARWVEMPNSRRKVTAAYAASFKQQMAYPAGARLILPGKKRPASDHGYVDGGNPAWRFIMVTYCVTYTASGSTEIRHTAGHVIFNKTSVTTEIDEGYRPVTTFKHYGIDVAD